MQLRVNGNIFIDLLPNIICAMGMYIENNPITHSDFRKTKIFLIKLTDAS